MSRRVLVGGADFPEPPVPRPDPGPLPAPDPEPPNPDPGRPEPLDRVAAPAHAGRDR